MAGPGWGRWWPAQAQLPLGTGSCTTRLCAAWHGRHESNNKEHSDGAGGGPARRGHSPGPVLGQHRAGDTAAAAAAPGAAARPRSPSMEVAGGGSCGHRAPRAAGPAPCCAVPDAGSQVPPWPRVTTTRGGGHTQSVATTQGAGGQGESQIFIIKTNQMGAGTQGRIKPEPGPAAPAPQPLSWGGLHAPSHPPGAGGSRAGQSPRGGRPGAAGGTPTCSGPRSAGRGWPG